MKATPGNIELKLNSAHVAAFQTNLSRQSLPIPELSPDHHSLTDSANRADDIQGYIFRAAATQASVQRRPGLQWWSPAMMVNVYHLRFVQTILRRYGRNPNQLQLDSLIAGLVTSVLSLNRPDLGSIVVDVTQLTINDHTIDDWKTVPVDEFIVMLRAHKKEIKRRLKYRTR